MHYVNCTADFISRLSKTYFPVVKQYLQLAWDALEHYVPLAWAQAQEIIVNISQGIYNMSPDFFDAIADGFRRLVNEVTTRTPHILALMQEYFITACKLVVSGLTSIVQWFQENLLR